MQDEPTTSQKRVFEFIREQIANGGAAPTYREICQQLGFRSTKAAADHVAALERKGFLVREKGRARGLRIGKGALGIPVLGRIVAGLPGGAAAEREARLAIDPTAFGIRDRSKAFAVRVTGDSMIGRKIFEGDIVLLEEGSEPRSGDVVAALIDNESTLKTFVRNNGRGWLQAENPMYPDLLPVFDLKIQGIARAVIRFLQI